jgi:hypothetical protein
LKQNEAKKDKISHSHEKEFYLKTIATLRRSIVFVKQLQTFLSSKKDKQISETFDKNIDLPSNPRLPKVCIENCLTFIKLSNRKQFAASVSQEEKCQKILKGVVFDAIFDEDSVMWKKRRFDNLELARTNDTHSRVLQNLFGYSESSFTWIFDNWDADGHRKETDNTYLKLYRQYRAEKNPFNNNQQVENNKLLKLELSRIFLNNSDILHILNQLKNSPKYLWIKEKDKLPQEAINKTLHITDRKFFRERLDRNPLKKHSLVNVFSAAPLDYLAQKRPALPLEMHQMPTIPIPA